MIRLCPPILHDRQLRNNQAVKVQRIFSPFGARRPSVEESASRSRKPSCVHGLQERERNRGRARSFLVNGTSPLHNRPAIRVLTPGAVPRRHSGLHTIWTEFEVREPRDGPRTQGFWVVARI